MGKNTCRTPQRRAAFSRQRLLAQAIRSLWLGSLAVSAAWPAGPAMAQESSRQYAIPAGNLTDTLKRFGSESGLLISFSTELTGGLRSPGVNGSYTPGVALRELLRQTGLEAVPQGSGYLLRRIPLPIGGEAQLAPMTVTASTERNPTTEGTGSYTTRVLSLGKMPLSIRETPQSVTVVTRQQMDDQNLVTVEDVIAQTTGTSKSQRNFGAHVYILRGFEIPTQNYLIDGVGGGGVYNPTGWVPMDTAVFDRVEVLRGAGALAVGVGDPSGVVNMVRKRPRAEKHLDVVASIGSWENYRTEVDGGGPLNEAGTLRGRVVAVYQDRKFFYDVAHSKEPMLYAVVDADLGSDTKATAGFRHQEVNIDGYAIFGLPRFTDGSALPLSRSTSLAQNWNRHEARIDDAFVELEHRLNDNWQAKLTFNQSRTTIDQKLGSARGAIDPATMTGTRMASLYFVDRDITASALDAHITGRFEAWGGNHQMMLGTSWSTMSSTFRSTTIALNTPVDVFNFDHGLIPEPDTPAFANDLKDRNRQFGIYGSARLQLAEPLHLLLGGRVSWYDFHTDNRITGKVTNDYQENAQFTPYAGLVYDLDRRWSLYTSYASTFVPQSQYSTLSGDTLKPAVGTNYEAGLKGELLDGKLNIALALFSIKKRDVALYDAANVGMCPGITTNDCYTNASLMRSKGVDLEAAGQLAAGWQVSAGYTHLKTADENGNSISSDTPRNILRAATSYRLPGAWEKWTVGANLAAQSSAYIIDGVRVTNPGRAILDLRAAYRIDPIWSLALNVGNVTDKTYFSAIGGPRNGTYYGTPRNFMLSLRGSF